MIDALEIFMLGLTIGVVIALPLVLAMWLFPIAPRKHRDEPEVRR